MLIRLTEKLRKCQENFKRYLLLCLFSVIWPLKSIIYSKFLCCSVNCTKRFLFPDAQVCRDNVCKVTNNKREYDVGAVHDHLPQQ